MSLSNALRRRAKSLAPGLALALLAASCAGSFNFRVHSTSPADVGSVFVLFGKESEFKDATRSPQIVKLIQPAMLDNYVGFAEYELDSSAASGPSWIRLNESLPKEIGLELEDPGFLTFTVSHKLLKRAPELAVAIILRTADNDFLIRVLNHATVAEQEGVVTLDLSEEKIERINP